MLSVLSHLPLYKSKLLQTLNCTRLTTSFCIFYLLKQNKRFVLETFLQQVCKSLNKTSISYCHFPGLKRSKNISLVHWLHSKYFLRYFLKWLHSDVIRLYRTCLFVRSEIEFTVDAVKLGYIMFFSLDADL